jgi:hypothetical protein
MGQDALSRRHLLRLGSGLAAAIAPNSWTVWAHNGGSRQPRSPLLREFVDPLLRLRPARQVGDLEGSPLYDIAAKPVRQTLHRDLPPTALWAYDGHFPGPTLDVRRGPSCHPKSDGQPDAWFTAGFEQRGAEWSRETYAYPNQQEACTLWYLDAENRQHAANRHIVVMYRVPRDRHPSDSRPGLRARTTELQAENQ